MTQYINKFVLVAEIEKLKGKVSDGSSYCDGWQHALRMLELELKTLEVKKVDLEKLGEIARHLIAVKEHIEDMRLNKEEWFMLEKIGYPEKNKAQKGEEV